jgi:tRNA nucleotidyltransferase (CCA-adding enzyme)
MSFRKAEQILHTLNEHGFEAYIVGGVVRDKLLGRELGDIDLATSALPQQVQAMFEKTIPVGIEHGTVIVRIAGESFEVTTFRTDGDYVDYRRPSAVRFHESIEADLARRDFTINAIALKQDGTLIDPFGGRDDLEHRLIRAVGDPNERFREDPLRMMRALRFYSLLGFQIHSDTYEALYKQAPLLEKISVERLRDEFEKLLSGVYCEQALQLILKSRIDHHLPNGPFQIETKHPIYDWTQLGNKEERWASFLLRCNVMQPYEWLRKWKVPNGGCKAIQQMVGLIREEQSYNDILVIYRYGLEMMRSAMKVERSLGRSIGTKEKELIGLYESLPIHNRKELVIDGNTLQSHYNRGPGAWIAELLVEVEELVVTGQLKNEHSEIKEWLNRCKPIREND